jgi:hypothetical protein
MSTRRIIGAVALVASFGVTSAWAQVSSVIVLRSGDRVRGSLVDMNASGFELTVNGNKRAIRPGDVAAISFTGDVSDNQWDAVRSGTTVIVLRNGQTVSGELYDIGGRSPLRITVRNNNGERELNSSEIARILFARPANADDTPSTPEPGAGGGPGVVLPATQQWVQTGVVVQRGETVNFQSTGRIRLSRANNDFAQVTGSTLQRYAPNSPLPQFLAGALIGRVGNGQPFAIGDQTSIPMPASGMLWSGVNDDSMGDNSGQYNVVVTKRGRRR